MKLALVLFTTVLTCAFAQAASAATYKGKCAHKAEDAAVNKWADVPNPDPNLEYATVSSEEQGRESDTYVVVLGFNDGNETSEGKYKVVFGDAGKCEKPVVSETR